MLSSHKIFTGEMFVVMMTLLCGHFNRTIAERWQHSPSTVSASLHDVIDVFKKKDVVWSCCWQLAICIGRSRTQEVHGNFIFLSLPVVGVVNFDLTCQLAFTGWEATAHDGRDALTIEFRHTFDK